MRWRNVAGALKEDLGKRAPASTLVLLLIFSFLLGLGNASATEGPDSGEALDGDATTAPLDDKDARPYVIVGAIALCALGVLAITLHTRKKKR